MGKPGFIFFNEVGSEVIKGEVLIVTEFLEAEEGAGVGLGCSLTVHAFLTQHLFLEESEYGHGCRKLGESLTQFVQRKIRVGLLELRNRLSTQPQLPGYDGPHQRELLFPFSIGRHKEGCCLSIPFVGKYMMVGADALDLSFVDDLIVQCSLG